ncbi:hypothetical protein AVEN_159949-1 [Araneus ventricosus]|uniref:Uncharacterized protein n=1 Tax=Araneus ventricosus TaxID=182803 RepID=A0A4Y2I3P5_ARAVE|nr:hypothetical protein AVEN_159949-1 [Araneus ventricosus]
MALSKRYDLPYLKSHLRSRQLSENHSRPIITNNDGVENIGISEETRLGMDYLLTKAISSYVMSIKDVEFNVFTYEQTRTTVMVPFLDDAEINPCSHLSP